MIGNAALRFIVAGAALWALGGCGASADYPAPERDRSQPDIPVGTSHIGTSVRIPLTTLRAEVERALDKRLWQIDETRSNCLPPQRIHALGRDIRVSPDISCRIQGHLDRGRLQLTGQGRTLEMRLPVSGEVKVRDIGGVIKQETVDAAAQITVRVSFGVSADWRLQPRARVSYRWRTRPGLNILGRTIDLTGRAEDRLSQLKPQIERQIERELAKVNLRDLVAPAWRSAFTVLSVNRENPPVWLRLSPQSVAFDRYTASSRALTLRIAVEGELQSFIGARPQPPQPAPLPALSPAESADGFALTIPVLADYSTVIPPLVRTLDTLEGEPITVPGVGAVKAQFGDVEIYPIGGGRIAVGIDVEAAPNGGWLSWLTSGASGQVWLAGALVSEADSEAIRIENLEVFGAGDALSGDLLVRLLRTETVTAAIQEELQANLSSDYARIDAKVRAALKQVRTGDWVLSADVDSLRHGKVMPTSAGLYMPVTAQGSAQLRYQPQ